MGHCPLYQMSYRLIVFGDKTSDGSTYGGQAVKLRYHRGTQKVIFRSYFFESTESLSYMLTTMMLIVESRPWFQNPDDHLSLARPLDCVDQIICSPIFGRSVFLIDLFHGSSKWQSSVLLFMMLFRRENLACYRYWHALFPREQVFWHWAGMHKL